jgi:Amt family ammonium transporter
MVGAVTGTVAGLATITPVAGVAGPLGAVLLGAAASCVCYAAVWLVKRVMSVDDALDVLGVHGVGGAMGTMLLPFVALIGAGGGHLNHPVAQQFQVQALAVIVVALFSAVATFVITKLADMLVGLRVDLEHETQGLDFATHGETGYHTNR